MFQFAVCEKSQKRLVISHKWQATLFLFVLLQKSGQQQRIKITFAT
jgi:hypothetical protein